MGIRVPTQKTTNTSISKGCDGIYIYTFSAEIYCVGACLFVGLGANFVEKVREIDNGKTRKMTTVVGHNIDNNPIINSQAKVESLPSFFPVCDIAIARIIFIYVDEIIKICVSSPL